MIENKNLRSEIKARLASVLAEVEKQESLAASYPPNLLPFDDEMKQIHEWIEIAGEYGIAYESIVATIEALPFVLSGKAAVSLLEVGLLLGYKTHRKEDSVFDRR
jgi:hypothetical protein